MKYFGEKIQVDIINMRCDFCFSQEEAWKAIHPNIKYYSRDPQVIELRKEFWNDLDTTESWHKPCARIPTGEYMEPCICLDCIHDLAREFEEKYEGRYLAAVS